MSAATLAADLRLVSHVWKCSRKIFVRLTGISLPSAKTALTGVGGGSDGAAGRLARVGRNTDTNSTMAANALLFFTIPSWRSIDVNSRAPLWLG